MAKSKNSGKPKRGQSAYLFFCADNRKEVMKDHSMTESSKILGKMWKDEENREKYEKMAAKDKKRYEAEMKKWTPPEPSSDDNSDADDSDEKKPKKKKKIVGGKKRAPSGYLLFGKDERTRIKKDDPDVKATEVMKMIGAAWKELDQTDRDKYNAKAKKAAEK